MKSNIEEQSRKRDVDPIFDNSYNKGEIEYEIFPEVKLDSSLPGYRVDIYYNAHEYARIELLNELIEDIWKISYWSKNFNKYKKIPKHDLGEIFSFIKKNFKDTTFTNSEIFVGISDFLDVNLKTLFDMVAPTYKQEIIKELNEKYNILNKTKIFKLF